jgi:predicted nucleic acid-binding protein
LDAAIDWVWNDYETNYVKLFDSLHLATAEYANVDAFLSTDVRLIKATARSDIKIRVDNPLKYYSPNLFNYDN